MSEITAVPEFEEVLSQDERTAQVIERTAKAIMKAHRIAIGYHGRPLRDDAPAWERHWDSIAPGVRIVYRNQARAALNASELLGRIEELEQRITAARRELDQGAAMNTAREWHLVTRRASRVLAKPGPEPEPIQIK